MKKILALFTIFILGSCNITSANEFDIINDGDIVVYNDIADFWSIEENAGQEVFTKTLYDGAGSYSQYLDENGKIRFTLTTDFEFVKDGVLYAIDNEELKYYKIVYNGDSFEEILLNYSEIEDLFPNAEIISLANIDDDNKLWIHKPLLQKKEILFVNDSNKYFHKLTAKCKDVQNKDIRGLVTISRYGIYRFKHFGERDGSLTLYIR